jgi:hypothetical protein
MFGLRPIALLGVASAVALSSSLALASSNAVLDDVGPGWNRVACSASPLVTSPSATCFADAGGAQIQIEAMDVPPGIRAREFVRALGATPLGTPLAIDGLPAARAYDVDLGDGSRTLLLNVPGREEVFSIWLTGAERIRPDPVQFLVDVGRHQQTRAGGSDTPARGHGAPTDRELERLIVSAPPRTGLQEVSLPTVQTGLERLRKIARTDRVVDLLKERQKTIVRAFASPTVIVVVELDRLPFDDFASIGLGTFVRRPDRSELPGLERVADAVAARPTPEQVMVMFRRGPYLVTIGTNSDAAALYFARRQAARLPPGDSGPSYFPSTTRAVATVIALTTGVCLAVVGVGRARARRFRRRSRTGTGDSAAADDVSGDARRLRRMGLTLIAVQVVAVDLMVLGICALLKVFRGLSPLVALGMLGLGLAVGVWFTHRQRRRELEAIGPETVGWRPSVPAPTGALLGALAIALLIAGTALLAYGAADLAFGSSLRTLERASSWHIDPDQLSRVLLVVGLVLVALGGLAFRLARMLGRAHAVELRQRDQRPPILYLRSFEDDQLAVATVLSARRPFFEMLRVRGTDPFEEAITWELAPYGPVIAVGRPGRSLASLGAAREHLADDGWQQDVAQLMGDCRAIVMTIGATDGLRWEVQRVAAEQHASKTIFVFPPLDGESLRERWRFTADALHVAGVDAPSLPDDAASVLTAVLDPVSTWRTTVAGVRDEATYRVAIDRSMPWLADAEPVPA